MESRVETKIVKTSLRMLHDKLCQLRFFCFLLLSFFGGISMQIVILISYSFFLCFTVWLVDINNSGAPVFNILAKSKSCGNICFFV